MARSIRSPVVTAGTSGSVGFWATSRLRHVEQKVRRDPYIYMDNRSFGGKNWEDVHSRMQAWGDCRLSECVKTGPRLKSLLAMRKAC